MGHLLRHALFITCWSIAISQNCSTYSNGCCPGTVWNSSVMACEYCKVGYYGENCSKPCVYPYYGMMCSEKCECPPGQCNISSGCRQTASYTPTIKGNKQTSATRNMSSITTPHFQMSTEVHLPLRNIIYSLCALVLTLATLYVGWVVKEKIKSCNRVTEKDQVQQANETEGTYENISGVHMDVPRLSVTYQPA